MEIHHIGYLTKSIKEGVILFQKLGFTEETAITEDMGRKIRVIFMINAGYRIELVEPMGRESPFWGLLKKYKNTAYHLCYQVNDIGRKMTDLRKNGYLPLQPLSPAPAIGDRNVVFMLHPDIGMIELLEMKDSV